VLSTSFSLHVVPWIEYFRCKVTFLGLLDFEASYRSSRPLALV
jgi:hypothetical protein